MINKNEELTDRQILTDIQRLARVHHQKWNQQIPLDSLESELAFWSWNKLEKLKKIYSDKGQYGYYKYLQKCAKQLLDRFSQDIMVENGRTVTTSFTHEDDGSILETVEDIQKYMFQKMWTMEFVFGKLVEKDSLIIHKAELSCTPHQFAVIKALYIDGDYDREQAKLLGKIPPTIVKEFGVKTGRTAQGINYLLERGIKNIITKDYL